MELALIVKEAFAEFSKGQIITDLARIEQVIVNGLSHFCTRLLVESPQVKAEEPISIPVPISPADGSNSNIEE